MADVPLVAGGAVDAPLGYVVPGAQEIIPKSITASFDGTSAAGPFIPTLQILAPNGAVLAACPVSTSVAAGASADVSWFPGVANSGGTIRELTSTLGSVSITNPFGPITDLEVNTVVPLDDYVFKNANTTVTGIGFNSQANLVIQGNPIVLDGVTRIKIEFFTPCIEIDTGAINQACGLELWDGVTNKGTIAYTVGNAFGANTQLLNAVKAELILTPPAGTHTYAIYAWKNVIGSSVTVFANTFIDGSGNFAPSWYRVTRT